MSTSNPLTGDAGGASTILTKKELREQRRLKAKRYRQLYLLPRFVNEEGGKRKLEAGEYDAKSELYPLSTPIDQLSDFGEPPARVRYVLRVEFLSEFCVILLRGFFYYTFGLCG
jgi:hypothetical protein